MYPRDINILKTKSFFLFGARATGKSYLVNERFATECKLWINLLNDSDFIRYTRNSGLLFAQCQSLVKEFKDDKIWVVIDEVQKIPALLNEVHRVLEDNKIRKRIYFGLTGSSARKLKRDGANLLAGRALLNYIFPLTFTELGKDFDLHKVINWGSLPPVYTEADETTRSETLESYYATYLREEIREEQLVRQLDPFTRFLEAAAQSSGKIVNYSSIANDCQVDAKAVGRYFQILEDTLLGIFLPSYHRSIRMQQSKSPKFLFFDLGVQRAIQGLLNIPLLPNSPGYGQLFEQFIILEIHRLNSYLRKRYKLFYLRTKDDAEIDLIVERPGQSTVLIEIKSSDKVSLRDARHLISFKSEFKDCEVWLISPDDKSRLENGVKFIPWRAALLELFGLKEKATKGHPKNTSNFFQN